MKRRLFTILSALSLLLCAAVVVAWWNARQDPTEVEVVFPAGYRGLAKVHFRTPDGHAVAREGRRYSYAMPSSGELDVRGPNPQYTEHVVTARYEDGTRLPVGYLTRGDGFPDGVVAVWPLMGDGDDAYFFVGTTEDRRRLQSEERERVLGR